MLSPVHLDILRLMLTLGEGGQQGTHPQRDQQAAQHQTSDAGQGPGTARANQSLKKRHCYLILNGSVSLITMHRTIEVPKNILIPQKRCLLEKPFLSRLGDLIAWVNMLQGD